MKLLAILACGLLACTAVLGQVNTVPASVGASTTTGPGAVRRVGDGFYLPAGCSYVVDYYGQCGGNGSSCNPASGVCADAQYPGACCPQGFTCTRQNPQYWQCLQSTPTYASTTLIPIPAYGQCGGSIPLGANLTTNALGQFVGTQCPVGYSCSYQSQSSSICKPNPMAAANSQPQSPYLDIISTIASSTGGNALAPGLQEYQFSVPGKDNAPPKPVDLIINTTQIEAFLDSLTGNTPPPAGTPPAPGAPGASPPSVVPSPAPAPSSPLGPLFNFTVPNITFQAPSPLSIVGTNIVNASGAVVSLRGFNWFGFETGDTIVQGLTPNFLTPRNFSQTGDFATVVYRQQALGWNTVRLPFRFGDLNLPARQITQPCSVDSISQIEGNLTNPTSPYNQLNYGAIPFPAQRAPPANGVATSGVCNSYLPSLSTLDRFLYVIQYYIGNGFYVIIDYHAGLGGIESDRQTVSNPSIFQANWVALLTAIQSLPEYNTTIKGRIMFDLLNEPDAFNMTWSSPNINSNGLFPNSTTVPAWGSLFTSTADILAQQEPAAIFLAEGTGQFNQPGTAYGMGFGINPSIYTNQAGLFNALGGLQTLVANDRVRARTVISPHVYPGQVTGWTIGFTDNTGLGLPYTYYNNFAYLSVAGVPPANGGANATFPILVGEYGTIFNSSYNATTQGVDDPLADAWANNFAEFNNNLNATTSALYPHQNIVNTVWWAWNGNQAQPLGLVNADPGNVPTYNGPPGWLEIQWIKINNQTNTLTGNPFYTPAQGIASGGGYGLRPWYLQ